MQYYFDVLLYWTLRAREPARLPRHQQQRNTPQRHPNRPQEVDDGHDIVLEITVRLGNFYFCRASVFSGRCIVRWQGFTPGVQVDGVEGEDGRRNKRGTVPSNNGTRPTFIHAQHTRVHTAALGEVVLGKCTRNRNLGLPYRQREGGNGGKKVGRQGGMGFQAMACMIATTFYSFFFLSCLISSGLGAIMSMTTGF